MQASSDINPEDTKEEVYIKTRTCGCVYTTIYDEDAGYESERETTSAQHCFQHAKELEQLSINIYNLEKTKRSVLSQLSDINNNLNILYRKRYKLCKGIDQ